MHMDMKYATIPMFAKETRWLYREAKFTYVVIDQNSPNNYPLYIDEEDMGCFILSLYMNLLRMKGSNIKSWNPPKSKITNYGNYFLTTPLQLQEMSWEKGSCYFPHIGIKLLCHISWSLNLPIMFIEYEP